MSPQSLLPNVWKRAIFEFWELLLLTLQGASNSAVLHPTLLISCAVQVSVICWNWVRAGCFPSFSFTGWNLEFFLLFFLKLNDMGCTKRWIHLSRPLSNMASWPHYSVRKGICLCDPFPPLDSSWHTASREQLEESSQDSSCSVRACDTQASEEIRTYIFHLLSYFVCVPLFVTFGEADAGACVRLLKGGKARKLVIKIKIQSCSRPSFTTSAECISGTLSESTVSAFNVSSQKIHLCLSAYLHVQAHTCFHMHLHTDALIYTVKLPQDVLSARNAELN